MYASKREYYLRKYFNPLLLESAVMYDDNGIILGSGTYAPWRQAIWKILGLPLLSLIHSRLGWIFETRICVYPFHCRFAFIFLILVCICRSVLKILIENSLMQLQKSIPEVMKSTETLIFLTQTNFDRKFRCFVWRILMRNFQQFLS